MFKQIMILCTAVLALSTPWSPSQEKPEPQKEQAQQLLKEGQVAFDKADYQNALSKYEAARPLFEQMNDKVGIAKALGGISKIYERMGKYGEALDYGQRALQIAKESGDQKEVASSLNNIGAVHIFLGDYSQALDYHQQALQTAKEIGDKGEEAETRSNMGIVHERLGDYGQALAYHQQALLITLITKEIGDKKRAAATLGNIGLVHMDLGDYKRALEYHQQALLIKQEIGDKSGVAATLGNMGGVYMYLGDYSQALDYHQQALQIRKELGDKRGVAYNLSRIAHAYYQRKDLPEADRYLLEALPLAKEIGAAEVLWRSLHLKGLILRESGQAEAAVNVLKEAVEGIEKMRGQIRAADQKANFLQNKLDVYEALVHLSVQLHQPAAAFHYAERGKARAFLDLLAEANADLRKKIRPPLLEKERMTLAQLGNLQQRWQGEAAKPRPDAKKVRSLQEQLRSLEQEYEAVKAEIRRDSPDYAALKYPTPITLAQTQPLLAAGEVLLEYVLGAEGSALFAVTKTGVGCYGLPPRKAVEEKVQALVTLLGQTPTTNRTLAYARRAAELYEVLVQPAQKEIAGKRTLLIATDGALALLPFAALLVEKANPREAISTKRLPYLVRYYDLCYIPSASVLAELHARPPKTAWEAMLVAFAPVDFGERRASAPVRASLEKLYKNGRELDRLPYTKKEVEWISALYDKPATKLYLERAATEEQVKAEALRRYRYVHFATHGIINHERPGLSAILLRNEGREDGYLQLAEIFNLDLNADMVVLSACESGRGKQMRGEGLIGLVRGFMYAGAASVVASLWNVRDQPTAYFMQEFYKNLEKTTKSQALRQAQLAFINSERPEWHYRSPPYYWSAFILTGER